MTLHRLCDVDDQKVGEAKRYLVDGVAVCLVRTDSGYRAISDTCSHADYSLSEGEVDLDECEIECWKHGSMFSLVTGEPTTFPATQPVAVYAVTEVDGSVEVELP